MKYSRQDKLFFRGIYGKVGKAIARNNLIESGDRILVGLSGGKDSLTMLTILAERRKSSTVPYELAAVHIRSSAAMYKTDESYLKNVCDSLGVPLYCEAIDVEIREGTGKPMCFVCSWNRRKRLFEMARKLHCNKIALGHHRDDAIVTMMMGMFYNGIFSGMPAKLSLFGGEIVLIRPLILLSEKEIVRFAGIRAFARQEKTCPYEDRTRRGEVEQLVAELEGRIPEIRESLFASMSNIKSEYL